MEPVTKELLEKLESLTGKELSGFMVCLCESYLERNDALKTANDRIAELETEIAKLEQERQIQIEQLKEERGQWKRQHADRYAEQRLRCITLDNDTGEKSK